jgi:hypothetical protein
MTNAHIIERLITYREHLNQRRQSEDPNHTVIQMKNICLIVYELVDRFDVSKGNAALHGIKSLTLAQLSEAQTRIDQLADCTTNLEEEDYFWDALNALTDPVEQFVDSIQASQV